MVGTRLPRAERRAQIVRAAASVFVQAGFDGTSMDDVARAAGVSRLIVYRIFDSKHALYTAVLDDVASGLQSEFVTPPSTTEGDGVAARLLRVGRAHPDGFRLLWRHTAHEPEFEKFAEQFRSFTYGYAETLISPAISDPVMRRWAARAVVSYLYEGVCSWLDEGDQRRDRDAAAVLTAGARAMITAWTLSLG